MKVSIIIPVYNAEKYLRECLDSVRAQTLSDLEIVCVDDGSTDQSAAILDEYAASDSRFVVIHKVNQGPGIARNTGLAASKGEYVLFVDSDDTIDETLCEKTVAAAEEEQAEMTFFYFDSNLSSKAAIENAWKSILVHRGFAIESNDMPTNIAIVEALSGPWSKLWKRQFLEEHALNFPAQFVFGEDFAIHWRSLMLSPRMAVVPEILYNYRYCESSLMVDPSRGYGRDIVAMYDYIKEHLRLLDLYHGPWRSLFLHLKLSRIHGRYVYLHDDFAAEMLPGIAQTYGDDERKHLKASSDLRWMTKQFYRSLDGSSFASITDICLSSIRRLCLRVRTYMKSRRSLTAVQKKKSG